MVPPMALDPMGWSAVGLTVGVVGRTLLAGVCLAGEKAPADPRTVRRSGHGWNDDVGGA
jgi:hypothetical protein